jgi:DNA-binding MarR family transcriptional regulator
MNAPVSASHPLPLRPVTGWEVIVTTRRFQHHVEVTLDRSLEPYALTFAQYRALELIARGRPIHVSELARRLRLTRQTVQVSVRNLYHLDLLDIERDGNLRIVSISEVGRRRLHHYREAVQDSVSSIETVIDHIDRHRLVSLMRDADKGLIPVPARPWWLAD